MDRNTVTGITLIVALFLGWMWYMQPSPEEVERMRAQQALRDSLASQQLTNQEATEVRPQIQFESSQQSISQRTGVFGDTLAIDTVITRVETERFVALFSNVGAGPISIELKDHQRWDGSPVQLINDTTQSAYSVGFVSTQNYNIETRSILFNPVNAPRNLTVLDRDSAMIRYELATPNGPVSFVYTFYPDRYDFNFTIDFGASAPLVSSRLVDFGFQAGLRFTEKSNSIEAKSASADLYAGEEHEQILLTSEGKESIPATGQIDWVATKTKFFTQIIEPKHPTRSAEINGQLIGDPSKESVKVKYNSSLTQEIPASNILTFSLYLGPLRMADLVAYDESTYKLVNLGYSFMRFFSEPLVRWMIIPFFEFTSGWITNYGLLIILFAFIVKLVLYPFTKKSFESMAAMGKLQPEMAAIKEKYADNPQKQQEAMLKLYKTAGVNPVGGCLPNLLQMPILITLWMFFQNSILIRQKEFLWASDLSAPDVILSLPFSIPFLGDHIAGFVLLMSASMVVQMQISGQTNSNPSMKLLPYIMPVFLFVFFNNMAAGLSLYYLIYNVLSIVQQKLIKKDVDHDKLLKTIEGKKKRTSRKK